jgi:hypothetical protein
MKLNARQSFKKLAPLGVVISTSVALLGIVESAGAVSVSLGTPYPVGSPEWNKFLLPESKPYLLIGNGPVNDFGGQPGIGQAVNMNNFELGANKAPVPSPSSFGPNTDSPDLLGNVLDIPINAATVMTGIDFSGNIAVTSGKGVFNLQDVGVYADPKIGIRCVQSVKDCDVGTQNSFFNDPKQFPNTFTANPSSPAGTMNTTGSGVGVNPNNADQSTRIDDPNFKGVTGNVDFTALKNEIFTGPNSANAMISMLTATGTLTESDGTIQPTDNAIFNGNPLYGSFARTNSTKKNGVDAVTGGTFTLTLSSGLHIIDVNAGGNDFQLDGINFVIDAAAGVTDPNDVAVIFRINQASTKNFLISNSNVLTGKNIGLNNVLFHTDRNTKEGHFNFNNTVINGAAFWTTEQKGGEIVINNAQGCTQLVADKINLNDVRFKRCHFMTAKQDMQEVPEPGTIFGLFAIAGLGLTARAKKKLLNGKERNIDLSK